MWHVWRKGSDYRILVKSRGGTNGLDVRIIFKWILNRIGGREIDWSFPGYGF
jgi:hypothetical protein